MNTPDQNRFNPRDYATKKTEKLDKPVTFWIIHIDDVTKSKIAKLEEWRRIKDPNDVGVDRLNRGKMISEVDVNADDANPGSGQNGITGSTNSSETAIYKLTLKDSFDNYCFAYEYNDQLPFLREGNHSQLPIPIKLGGKLVIKAGTLIANGTLLLKRGQCNYLGVDNTNELVKNLNSNLIEKSINILQNPDL